MIEAADLRDALSINDETVLQRLAEFVVASWERLTGRIWKQASGVDLILTPEENAVFIWSKLYPMSALSIKEWWNTDLEADAVTVATTDYRTQLNTESGKITRLRTDPWRDYVKLTVTGGYTAASAPAEVRSAMIAQAIHMNAKNKPNRAGITNEAHGKSGSATYDTSVWHPDFKELAAVYRRV